MRREEYEELSIRYFSGELSLEALIERLESEVDFSVEEAPLPGERVILIANHPAGDPALNISADRIAGCKGGNHRNFPDFRFPILRQLMLRKALKRRFLTIAFDIGWRDAMQEMWHLLIRSSGNGRCQEIISLTKGSACSLVIFPEGGARDLEVFRTGYFHIACELGIRKVILGAFSAKLTLEGKNRFRVVSVEDIGPFVDSAKNFVEKQKERIRKFLPI